MVRHELGVPLVILGGPAGGGTEELCTLVADAVTAGARGITIGRRVWQRPIEEATEVLSGLAAIVHPARTVGPGRLKPSCYGQTHLLGEHLAGRLHRRRRRPL